MFIKETMPGMRDLLPEETEIRERLLQTLKATYRAYGYSLIETPAVEHIENLTGNQGGENEKLIFKILKRGEKLEKALGAADFENLCDSALRYDLTVPLARYFASNKDKLLFPFKAMQTGSVWRADRPQKGRYRQFTQCDIDVIGEPSNAAETELIAAAAEFLESVGVNFKIVINDRRILRAMAAQCGFADDELDRAFIITDKIDKIGIGGVSKELLASGFAENVAGAYVTLIDGALNADDRFNYIEGTCKNIAGIDEALKNLAEIRENVDLITDCGVNIEFDPSLVRGMGYYTGTIFEIKSEDFNGSIGGGGRYDGMIAGFIGGKGQDAVYACGFSIGFERMVQALLERKGGEVSNAGKTCVLYDASLSSKDVSRIQKKYAKNRRSGETVLVQKMRKNLKAQIKSLEENGYTEFVKVRGGSEI